MIRVVTAVVHRELLVQRRYPISMVNLVLLTPLYEMAIPSLLLGSAFLINGSAVGLERVVGTTDLAGWLGLGLLVASMVVGAVWSVTGTLVSDRVTGVLEHSWASPASREAFVFGGVLTGTLFTVAANALLLGFAILVLGARYDPVGALISVPVLVVMLVGSCGFGYLAAAATLLMRRPGSLVDPVTTLVVTFSGVAFPLAILPRVVQFITYAFPTTWALDLIRGLTLHSAPMLSRPVEVGALTVTALALFAVGRFAFLRADRRTRSAGALTQF